MCVCLNCSVARRIDCSGVCSGRWTACMEARWIRARNKQTLCVLTFAWINVITIVLSLYLSVCLHVLLKVYAMIGIYLFFWRSVSVAQEAQTQTWHCTSVVQARAVGSRRYEGGWAFKHKTMQWGLMDVLKWMESDRWLTRCSLGGVQFVAFVRAIQFISAITSLLVSVSAQVLGPCWTRGRTADFMAQLLSRARA